MRAIVITATLLVAVAVGCSPRSPALPPVLSRSQGVVRQYIMQNAADPDSVEFVKWSPAIQDEDGSVLVMVTFRESNGFGAAGINTATYLVENGKVVRAWHGENARALYAVSGSD